MVQEEFDGEGEEKAFIFMVEVDFKREEEGSRKFFVKVLWEKLRSNRWRKANISAENTSFILVCLVLGRKQK